MPETIVAAAIRAPVSERLRVKTWNGEACYPDAVVLSAPPPARHHTLMHAMHDMGLSKTKPDDQGFLTSAGRFVGREEALNIAKAAGQPLIDHPSRHSTWLFSEDLW